MSAPQVEDQTRTFVFQTKALCIEYIYSRLTREELIYPIVEYEHLKSSGTPEDVFAVLLKLGMSQTGFDYWSMVKSMDIWKVIVIGKLKIGLRLSIIKIIIVAFFSPVFFLGDELESMRPCIYRDVAKQLNILVDVESMVSDAFFTVAMEISSTGKKAHTQCGCIL